MSVIIAPVASFNDNLQSGQLAAMVGSCLFTILIGYWVVEWWRK